MATRSSVGARPTVVCFVRHGTTPTTGKILPGRAKGLHLAQSGEAEADRAGARLAVVGPVAALYCSPLERARETAKAIARHLGVPVTVERGLLECDFGEWTGAELAALRKLPEWEAVVRHPSGFRFPGGESFVELQGRMAATVERLIERHRGETVVAVSHADPIKIAICDAMGVPLDLVQRTVVSPCSVSVVSYAPGGPAVLAVNSTGELSALGFSGGTHAASGRRA
jgi:probable phosphoglycerate mutase